MEKEKLQEICYKLAKEHGKEVFIDLSYHIGGGEDKFDPKGEDDITPCRTCSATNFEDEYLEWTKGRVVNPDRPEDDRPIFLWDVNCTICGDKYQMEGYEVDT